MLHIIVNNGVVTDVIVLGKTPDDRPQMLEMEIDYKVEYYPCDDEESDTPF
jgi:hypothetical protein